MKYEGRSMKGEVRSAERGFTLAEVLVVLVLFSMIVAMPLSFLWGFGRSDTVVAASKEVVSIIHEAQTDTISGRSYDGTQPTSFGVHFESTYYVYFQGSSYDPSDTTNQRTDLSPGLTFSTIGLPNNNIIFDRPTGTVAGFDESQNYVEIVDSNTNITKRVTVTRLGALSHD